MYTYKVTSRHWAASEYNTEESHLTALNMQDAAKKAENVFKRNGWDGHRAIRIEEVCELDGEEASDAAS